MKLEEIKQYKVGSKIFETKEEAEAYLKEQELSAIRQGVSEGSFPLVPIIYYENVVSINDEGHLRVTARWFSLADAIEDMKNYSDFQRSFGTGFVYKVTVSLRAARTSSGDISVQKEIVMEK